MESNQFIFLEIIFLILLFINRFYRGERSEGYLLYFLPFILIFTSFIFSELMNVKNHLIKNVSIILFIVLISLNFQGVTNVLKTNNYLNGFEQASTELSKNFPNNKFSIYDYKYKQYVASMPLSLVLSFAEKEDPNGIRIGFICSDSDCPKNLPSAGTTSLNLVRINDISNKKIWINVNQESVYNDLIGWLNKNQLKSTFSLADYLKSKFGI